MIKEKAKNKMFEALKNKDMTTKTTYAFLVDKITNKEIELRRPLTEAEEIAVVETLVKQLKNAVTSVEGVDSAYDFVAKTQKEIDIYSAFLPEQLSETEIANIIKETMTEVGIEKLDNKNKGILLKTLMPKVKGKADGKLVSNMVQNLIS